MWRRSQDVRTSSATLASRASSSVDAIVVGWRAQRTGGGRLPRARRPADARAGGTVGHWGAATAQTPWVPDPPRTHIKSMFTQWVPHTSAAEPNEAELKEHADRAMSEYGALAPGFEKLILHRRVIGPYEMEHDYGVVVGNIFHGELTPDQLFHLRPAPGYADFTTPIRGLNQCSSATHGGGGVTWIAGHLCSRRAIKDRKRWR